MKTYRSNVPIRLDSNSNVIQTPYQEVEANYNSGRRKLIFFYFSLKGPQLTNRN